MAGLGFGVALLITQPGIRGKTVFRSLILVPWAFPAFITILIWKNLLDQHYGAVNQALSLIFHISPNWTGSTPLAMISVIFVNLWLRYKKCHTKSQASHEENAAACKNYVIDYYRRKSW